jgi:hypothetical protein
MDDRYWSIKCVPGQWAWGPKKLRYGPSSISMSELEFQYKALQELAYASIPIEHPEALIDRRT